MKWRLIGITWYGLLNISGIDMELLFKFAALVLVLKIASSFCYEAIEMEYHTAEQINRAKRDHTFNKSRIS